jgi:hypothetical protein
LNFTANIHQVHHLILQVLHRERERDNKKGLGVQNTYHQFIMIPRRSQ